MASADSHDRESGPFERLDHLRPRNGREGAGHQATSRVSVSSSGGPASASNASSAARRSATAASAVGPSPTAPTQLCEGSTEQSSTRSRGLVGFWAAWANRTGSTSLAYVSSSASRPCRRRSPGNGDGRWPKPGTSGCSWPYTVALSLIAAGQTDVGVLDTSRRACRQLASERRHITWLVT
jgi:hypothetical protein